MVIPWRHAYIAQPTQGRAYDDSAARSVDSGPPGRGNPVAVLRPGGKRRLGGNWCPGGEWCPGCGGADAVGDGEVPDRRQDHQEEGILEGRDERVPSDALRWRRDARRAGPER